MRGRLAGRLSILVVASLLLAPGVSAGPWSGPWVAWVRETVDARNAGWGALALDADGNPRIAYHISGGGATTLLVQATRDALGWRTEVLPSPIARPGFPTLAVDAAGHSHLAYDNSNGGGLRYLHWDGSTWVHEVADADKTRGVYPRLALTPDGRPHVIHSLSNAVNTDTYYSTKGPGGWTTEHLRSRSDTFDSGLTSDAAGVLHAVTQGQTTGRPILYMRLVPGGSWEIEEVIGGGSPSLAVTPAGQVHLTYVATHPGTSISTGLIFHATKINGVWEHTHLGSPVSVVGDTSLALDSAGTPHITYRQRLSFDAFSDLTGKIYYAARLPTGHWTHELLDPHGFHGRSWIQVGPDDLPRVSYEFISGRSLSQFTGGSDVKYAEPAPARATALRIG